MHTFRALRQAGLVAISLLLLLGPAAWGAAPGVTSAEYRLPAGIDPDIAPEMATEIWARLYRPTSLTKGPYPLVLMLHGNHATCGRFDRQLGIRIDDDDTYTYDGTCPSGEVVAPSHLGYGYLAEKLAADGFVVVSINANRGINGASGDDQDWGLNLRRGRLVLKHLQLLSQWSRSGGTPSTLGVDLRGKLDLGRVGLMGHSRGGEGMRGALAQLRDKGSPWPKRIGAGLAIKALYEIGPVDGQSSRVLDAAGVAWNVLLPYCDGDVSDLEGVHVFDRMLLRTKEKPALPKSSFAVWGANHNFFNTEWQESDSAGCADHDPLFPQNKGSAAERATALGSVVPFMRAYLGSGSPQPLAALLDPDVPLPSRLAAITRIDRGYTDALDRLFELQIENFNQPTGTSSAGKANLAQGITVEHLSPPNDDPVQRAAAITWSGSGKHLFQTNWTGLGSGRDIAAYKTLEFRAARQCADQFCEAGSPLNPTPATDFSVQLVADDGSLSKAVRLASYLQLRGPVGLGNGYTVLHPILSTARIPLSAFGLGPRPTLSAVRFSFDQTASGAIYLANLRLSKLRATDAATTSAAVDDALSEAPITGASAAAAGGAPAARGSASIVAIHRPVTASSLGSPAGSVEIEIQADRPMPVTDALPLLKIGGSTLRRGHFGPGRTDRIVFSLDDAAFAGLQNGAAAELQLGAAHRLPLGGLDKSMLR